MGWSESSLDFSNNGIAFEGMSRSAESMYKREQVGLHKEYPTDGPLEKVLENLVCKTESNAQAIVKLDERISAKKKTKKVKSRKGENYQEKDTVVVLRTQAPVVQRSTRGKKAKNQNNKDNDAVNKNNNSTMLPFVIANPLSKRHPIYQPADRADTHIWQGYDDTHPDPYENVSTGMRNSISSQSPGRSSKTYKEGLFVDGEEIFDVKYDTSSLLNLIEDFK